MCKDKPQHPSAFQRQARGTRTPALFRSEQMMQCLLVVTTSMCGTFPPTLGQPHQIQTVSPTFTHHRWTSSETLTAALSGLSWFVKQVWLCCFSVGICQIYHVKSHWHFVLNENAGVYLTCPITFDLSQRLWPRRDSGRFRSSFCFLLSSMRVKVGTGKLAEQTNWRKHPVQPSTTPSMDTSTQHYQVP